MSERIVALNREQTILDHLPQVRRIALKMHKVLPICVLLDDLVSMGTIGLIAAVDHFDPGRGFKLKTYAEYRIRGEMFDGLRKIDWKRRADRDYFKRMEAAVGALEQEHQREPEEDQIAAWLSVSIAEYRKCRLHADTQLLSLDFREENGRPFANCVADPEPLPDAQAAASREARRIRDAIARLPKRQQIVINLYFYEDATLREIAARLGVNESRASQLKRRALEHLREYLGGQAIPPAQFSKERREQMSAGQRHRWARRRSEKQQKSEELAGNHQVIGMAA